MKITTKKTSETRVELTVKLDAEVMLKAHAEAVKYLAKNVKVQGFRQGKAPIEVAEKWMNPAELVDEEANFAVNMAIPAAFEKEKLQPLMMPEVEVKKFVPKGMMEFVLKTEILPEVKLGDYKDLKVEKKEVKVAKKEIDEVLQRYLEVFAESKEVERAAKLGDEVVIDFEGSEDGDKFEGGAAKDYVLALGSGQFIAGFEDGIVGHKIGEEFVLNLSFPKDYPAKEHAGKKVDFKVKLKKVQEKILPELNDEFAKKNTNFATLEELKKDIENGMKERKESEAKVALRDGLVEALLKKTKVAVPEIMIEDQMRMIRVDAEQNAKVNGVANFEQYLKMIGETEESWQKESKKMAEQRAKATLVLMEIAKQEKMSVSEDELNEKIAELKKMYGNAKEVKESFKNPRVLADLRHRMLLDKVVDLLEKKNK